MYGLSAIDKGSSIPSFIYYTRAIRGFVYDLCFPMSTILKGKRVHFIVYNINKELLDFIVDWVEKVDFHQNLRSISFSKACYDVNTLKIFVNNFVNNLTY